MKEKFNLVDTLKLFLYHWWKILIAGILCGAIFCGYTLACIPESYTSRGTIYINNSGIGNETDNPLYANLTDIATAQQLAFTCAKILTSESFLTQVEEAADLPYSAKQLQGMVSMEPVDETEILSIRAIAGDPEDAQLIVNTIMDLATDEIHRVVGAGNIRIIDYGNEPTSPSSPNIPQNTLIGFVLGLLLCAAVIFILDYFDKRLKIEADLMNVKELPMIGVIPEIEASKENLPTDRILTEKSHFSVAEAYKVSRTNLMFTLTDDEPCKRVLITSSNPSEGKSTTSINLAITFAQTGARVLIIDADLRRPKLHRYLDRQNEIGLSECLGGFKTADEVIQHVEAYNLDCIPGGSLPPNPSELLMSNALRNLLDSLAQRYDYIFVDSPPVNAVTDSASIAELMSGVLLVVKQNETTEDALGCAVSNLEFSSAKILGYLFNGYKAVGQYRGKYYNYRSGGYGYKYHYSQVHEGTKKEVKSANKQG